MPAALDVNWGEVRMLAQNIGVREAARRMGISEEAVKKRCTREGWIENLPRNVSLPPTMLRVVPNVPSGAQAQANVIKERILRTRMNHTETALIVSEDMLSLAKESPKAFRDPDTAGVLLTTAKHAALAGGWQDQAPTAKLSLHITSAGDGNTLEANVISEDVLPAIEEDPLAGF